MTESENEPKPQRSIHPGRWVFRATIAMVFIAVGILGVRVFRFYVAVDAVHQHGGGVYESGTQSLDNHELDLGDIGLFFSQEITVKIPDFLNDVDSVNDHDLQTLIPHLQQFDKLYALGLTGTDISDEGLSYLVDFNHLARLYISGTNITDHGLQHLSGLENLEYLSLDDCNITDEGVRHLQNLKTLESLSLDGTDITDEGLKHLRSLTNLKDLSVSNTGVTDEGCAELLKAIPDLEILDD